MSKTSLLIGCVLAAAVHGLLLWDPSPVSPPEPVPAEAPPKATLVTAPAPDPKPVPPTPKPKPKPVPPKAGKAAPTPTPPLQKVAQAPAQPEPERPEPKDPAPGADDAALPPMRIAWASPQQVRAVARALGLRIVAVNADAEAVGQIDPYDGRLADFTGRLDQYSNRVRTLPRGFFGTSAEAPGRGVARFWILVPAAVDRQWMALQRSAIAERGMKVSEVREVEARFTGSGTPRLSITQVHGRRRTDRPERNKET